MVFRGVVLCSYPSMMAGFPERHSVIEYIQYRFMSFHPTICCQYTTVHIAHKTDKLALEIPVIIVIMVPDAE